jgi:hypothetical protein
LTEFRKTGRTGNGAKPGLKRPGSRSLGYQTGRVTVKNIKNVSVLAAFAAFAVVAMIGNVTVAAPVEPGASVESITASIIIPVTQELPFDRYWSKD